MTYDSNWYLIDVGRRLSVLSLHLDHAVFCLIKKTHKWFMTLFTTPYLYIHYFTHALLQIYKYYALLASLPQLACLAYLCVQFPVLFVKGPKTDEVGMWK